jgi:hypothetical protein
MSFVKERAISEDAVVVGAKKNKAFRMHLENGKRPFQSSGLNGTGIFPELLRRPHQDVRGGVDRF